MLWLLLLLVVVGGGWIAAVDEGNVTRPRPGSPCPRAVGRSPPLPRLTEAMSLSCIAKGAVASTGDFFAPDNAVDAEDCHRASNVRDEVVLMGRREGVSNDGWIGWLISCVVVVSRRGSGLLSVVVLMVVVVAVAVVLVASEMVRCLMTSRSNIRRVDRSTASSSTSISSSTPLSSTLLICPLSSLPSLSLSTSVHPLPLPLLPVPLAHPTSFLTPARK